MKNEITAKGAGLSLALMLVGSLLRVDPAGAAIAVDDTSSALGKEVTSLSWDHTVGAGSNRILVVGVSWRSNTNSLNSITFGGTALELIDNKDDADVGRVAMYKLLAPAVCQATVQLSFSANVKVIAGAISFSGVDQSSPHGSFTAADGGDDTPTITVSSAADELVLDTFQAAGNASSASAGAGQTQYWYGRTQGGANEISGGGSTEPGASSVTMSWSLAGNANWSIGAISLRPASGVSPDIVSAKTETTYSDPINGTTNPKAIPGAFVDYSITTTNQGEGSPDANSVIVSDSVPASSELFVGDLGGAGSGPVLFTDGAIASGLTYSFTSLGSTTDDVDFSSDGGATFDYTPVPDGNGCDASVTHVRVNPQGTFNGASGGDSPSFDLRIRVRVQ